MITPYSIGEDVIKVSSEPIDRLLQADAAQRPRRHPVCREESFRALLYAANAPSDESASYERVNAAKEAQTAQRPSPDQFAVLQVDIPHLLLSNTREHGDDRKDK